MPSDKYSDTHSGIFFDVLSHIPSGIIFRPARPRKLTNSLRNGSLAVAGAQSDHDMLAQKLASECGVCPCACACACMCVRACVCVCVWVWVWVRGCVGVCVCVLCVAPSGMCILVSC